MAAKKLIKKGTISERIGRGIYWTPRILSVAFILFLMMFSLDVFGSGGNALEILVGLFVHNIPVVVLIILTAIAWRKEVVGAAGFAFAGSLYIALLIADGFKDYMLLWVLNISGPAFLVALLYWLCWKRRRRLAA